MTDRQIEMLLRLRNFKPEEHTDATREKLAELELMHFKIVCAGPLGKDFIVGAILLIAVCALNWWLS